MTSIEGESAPWGTTHLMADVTRGKEVQRCVFIFGGAKPLR